MSASVTAFLTSWAVLVVLTTTARLTYGYNGPATAGAGTNIDITQYQAGCTFVCTVAPTSLKCFRCKNRIPMRFGKRSVQEQEDESAVDDLLRNFFARLRIDINEAGVPVARSTK
ncbi:hypothetical protein BV898_06181 [Hypsibius exemplaris]|uniref:Secreted protein n=1 Tax=Hypsibius exemplaris TaxID=2072580 RepID=A0A1W0WXN8_HYPEX|nr:hypothetical protein BV898_06181 [Hypsibius exemplaris]